MEVLQTSPLGHLGTAPNNSVYQNFKCRILRAATSGWNRAQASLAPYFFSAPPIRTSRKNRAASSGGVGLI
jgi:hypothetical protein